MAPFDHKNVDPVETELSVTDPPGQNEVAPDVFIIVEGEELTITFTGVVVAVCVPDFTVA